jgi:hypothetical protein
LPGWLIAIVKSIGAIDVKVALKLAVGVVEFELSTLVVAVPPGPLTTC